jgi:methylated-DNA-protein-cysteine methyltransferase-like protein
MLPPIIKVAALDEFEQQLYTWLAQIPSGRVVTYGQLAKLIGRPNGARWVGRQMGRIPRGSGLPWYRVINASGRSSIPLDESGSNRQLRLLQREGVLVVDGRVSLARYRWDPFGS